jgi:hypothetical protein
MGAYLNTMETLDMDFGIIKSTELVADTFNFDRKGWIPARIHLADYPQLKQLAWQVHGTDELTPAEALSIYERNWRHVDMQSLVSIASNHDLCKHEVPYQLASGGYHEMQCWRN